ncbi:High affinity Ca2+/Mn2+ P-type ATPase-like protein [Blastocladiella emersonii ATCC 22665]|nr:High affinity Ca2+/Mn2+ P-type ATPase-like protein [Blastocladiella emersonii ATCC 22665]
MSVQPTAVCCHKPWEDVARELQTDAVQGLASSTAAVRLAQYGTNELHVGDDEPWYLKLLEQFQNPLSYLLLASAAVSLLVGEWDNAFSIALAIAIVATVAFVQEYKSEQSLQALNTLVPHHANVIRDGMPRRILGTDLVPGDVCTFSTGDRIPADVRLVEAVDLQVDEATLTGETKPVRKTQMPLERAHKELAVSERKNVCYMGTLVKNGYGTGIVVGTAKSTEFGAIFLMMRDVEVKKTPLQQRMDELGNQLSIVSTAIIFVILLIGWGLQGRSLLDMFTISVSLAVAAIPEGLPVVVTVTLALGVLRLAERKAIVKRLPSIETLSCVNVLCCDKTGTLTTNQMTAQHIWTPAMPEPVSVHEPSGGVPIADLAARPDVHELLACANLCNHARVDPTGRLLGQSTDCALLDLATRQFGLPDLRASAHLVAEHPFNSDHKCMVTTWRLPSGADRVYMKGALEPVLAACTTVGAGGHVPLEPAHVAAIAAEVERMATRGLRVLALAAGNQEGDLAFLGLVSIHDPPRAGVQDTVRRLQHAGVRVIMMTGDAESTARSIAAQVGIVGADEAVSGKEMDLGSAATAAAADQIGRAGVFYRMSPANKLDVVRSLQAMGCVVSVLGDGVNDAPALRLADIGVSMGVSGTDVCKEAADVILVNDDLSTLVTAIEEGKSIFMNIRNFLSFQLSTSISALSLVAIATFVGLPNPLNAMQILWINIIMDGPPAQSLGVEPVDKDAVENTSPRPSSAPIITHELVVKVLTSAAVIVTGTLFVYYMELVSGASTEHVTTMTFSIFVMYDMFNALSCRSLTKSIFEVGFLTNRMFNYALGFSLLGHLCVVYVPPFQRIFQTLPLSLADWALILSLASIVFWVDEMRKLGAGRVADAVMARPKRGTADPSPSPRDPTIRAEDQQQRREREINMGRATWVLRHELDTFCEWGISDTSIYARDMRFYDPHSRLHLTSRTQYLWGSRALRWILAAWFVDPRVTLTKITQHARAAPARLTSGGEAGGSEPTPPGEPDAPPPDPLPADLCESDEGALRVGFIFTGLPRHRWAMAVIANATGMRADPSRFVYQVEGTSVYTFNRAGLIHAHWIERLVPRPTLLNSTMSEASIARAKAQLLRADGGQWVPMVGGVVPIDIYHHSATHAFRFIAYERNQCILNATINGTGAALAAGAVAFRAVSASFYQYQDSAARLSLGFNFPDTNEAAVFADKLTKVLDGSFVRSLTQPPPAPTPPPPPPPAPPAPVAAPVPVAPPAPPAPSGPPAAPIPQAPVAAVAAPKPPGGNVPPPPPPPPPMFSSSSPTTAESPSSVSNPLAAGLAAKAAQMQAAAASASAVAAPPAPPAPPAPKPAGGSGGPPPPPPPPPPPMFGSSAPSSPTTANDDDAGVAPSGSIAAALGQVKLRKSTPASSPTGGGPPGVPLPSSPAAPPAAAAAAPAAKKPAAAASSGLSMMEEIALRAKKRLSADAGNPSTATAMSPISPGPASAPAAGPAAVSVTRAGSRGHGLATASPRASTANIVAAAERAAATRAAESVVGGAGAGVSQATLAAWKDEVVEAVRTELQAFRDELMRDLNDMFRASGAGQ